MKDRSTLIFGTTYIKDGDQLDTLISWVNLMERLNCELLLVDSDSPIPFHNHVSWDGYLYSFPDNIGHLARDGHDGWGRAFCKGIEIAIRDGYEFVVHVESDLLFGNDPRGAIAMMKAMPDVGIVAAKSKRYGWLETALMVMKVSYLKEISFIEKYNWPAKVQSDIPEQIIADICKGHIVYADWSGDRDEDGRVNPYTCDYITHTVKAKRDIFMERFNGIPRQ